MESAYVQISTEIVSSWYVKLLTIVALTLLGNYIASLIISKLHNVFSKTKPHIDDIMLSSLKPPVHMVIILVGLYFIFELITNEFDLKQHQPIAHKMFSIATILGMLWFVTRLINKLEKYWSKLIKTKKDSKLDQTSIGAIAKILRILSLVLAGLLAMDTLGFNISGILALGGVGGVVIGFASKDLLANLFGALMIYLDQPFKIGDWIKLSEKNIEGYVEKIGLRCTIIRTFERRPLYLPNSIFTHVAIENPSRMTHRRIDETIGIRPQDFCVIEKILSEIRKMLADHPDVDKKQTCCANFMGFSNSALNINIYCFTKSVDLAPFYLVQEDVLIKVGKIIDKFEAEIAHHPHHHLYIEDSSHNEENSH